MFTALLLMLPLLASPAIRISSSFVPCLLSIYAAYAFENSLLTTRRATLHPVYGCSHDCSALCTDDYTAQAAANAVTFTLVLSAPKPRMLF
jgi:hypothetical protein